MKRRACYTEELTQFAATRVLLGSTSAVSFKGLYTPSGSENAQVYLINAKSKQKKNMKCLDEKASKGQTIRRARKRKCCQLFENKNRNLTQRKSCVNIQHFCAAALVTFQSEGQGNNSESYS